jgi:gamma-glutamylcyclotransferase (GGCT)/AIG2-like uncharacterized protein YtfP
MKGKAPPEISSTVSKLKTVGRGYVVGTLLDAGDFPALRFDLQRKSKIPGIVYQLPSDPKTLTLIDRYEEFNPESPETSLFVRKLVEVAMTNGETLRAWVYEYNRPTTDFPLVKTHISEGIAA